VSDSRFAAQMDKRFGIAFAKLLAKVGPRECLIRDQHCSGPVIKAHSDQSSGILDSLVRDGHIYMIRPEGISGFSFELVGKNKATTFTGFCNHHDSTLFAPIDYDEKRTLDPSDLDQAVLFSLRSVAREYWLKLRNFEAFSKIRDLASRRDIEVLKQTMNIDDFHARQLVDNLGFIRAFLHGTKCSVNRFRRMFYSLFRLFRQVRSKD